MFDDKLKGRITWLVLNDDRLREVSVGVQRRKHQKDEPETVGAYQSRLPKIQSLEY
jgi:hypothetical protein